MAVGRSHAERTFSLWCYRLWNQGLFCFCFCLPMHTYMDGMISDFDVFCGEWWFCCRWFLVNMVSLPSLMRVVTSRRDQLSSELTRSFNPLMKTNSTLPKLGKKRSSSNLKLARMDKSSSFQMLQLIFKIKKKKWALISNNVMCIKRFVPRRITSQSLWLEFSFVIFVILGCS